MSYLVFAFGLALSVGGAFAIYFGYGIVSVERGWASVIAGAAALSGGVVTMALGLILNSLSRLRTVLEAEPSAIPLPGEVRLYPDEDYADAPYAESFEAVPPEAPPIGADFEDAPEHASWRQPGPEAETMEDIRRIVAEKVRARTGIVDATAGQTMAPPPDADSGQPGLPAAPHPDDDGYGEAEDYDPRPIERGAPDHFGRPVEQTFPAASGLTLPDEPRGHTAHQPDEKAASEPEAPAVRETEGRVVTRRYESAGTVYVMYADGSIEAQSEHGVMHFESMTELKAFMDG
jgi:hypothetical protein